MKSSVTVYTAFHFVKMEDCVMWGFIIACISGALMSIQGVFNTGVTKQSGPWITNSFVQLTEMGKVSVGQLLKVNPKYMLLGGVIGAFITLTVIKSMEMLGPAQAILAIVITQVLVGYLIELFGLFGVEKVPFSWTKCMGMLLSIIGVVIFELKK